MLLDLCDRLSIPERFGRISPILMLMSFGLVCPTTRRIRVMPLEEASSVLDEIRRALKGGGGSSMPKEMFYVPDDGVKVIRALNEPNDLFIDGMAGMNVEPSYAKVGSSAGPKCPYHKD